MGDQNRFEEYRQKLLQYWGVFLTFCGKLWEKAKTSVKKAAAFLAAHGKTLAQQAAAWAVKAVEFAKAQAKRFAAWLVTVREDLRKEDSLPNRAKLWCAGMIARVKVPREVPQLPEQTENVVDAAPAAAEETPVQLSEPEAAAEAVPVVIPTDAVPEEEPVPESIAAVMQDDASVLEKVRRILAAIGLWIRRLYKFVMAAPVVYMAIKLALQNMKRLPYMVGLDIQSNGEFRYVITREIAVFGPLALTVFCLALMFFAKKPVLPWVVSIFTLVVPLLLWITNLYA